VARYGGEEFAVILPNTDRYGAMELAEKIRSSIESLNVPHNSSLISDKVTMSLGVATAYRENLSFPEQIISFADEALYKAKEKGRNRVEFSESLSQLENKTNLVTLTWNRVDESGNHLIDGQHKTLLEDNNQLITALINRASKEVCAMHLDKLIEDIKIHFRDEEEIFLKTKYPYAKNHIISHNNLIKKVEILRNKNYPIPPNLEEVVSFVIYDVVAQHLAIEDKGYFPYISEDIKDANKQ
jgi:hemerythrin-like metal-binding protein